MVRGVLDRRHIRCCRQHGDLLLAWHVRGRREHEHFLLLLLLLLLLLFIVPNSGEGVVWRDLALSDAIDGRLAGRALVNHARHVQGLGYQGLGRVLGWDLRAVHPVIVDKVAWQSRVLARDAVIARCRKHRTARVSKVEQRLVVDDGDIGAHRACHVNELVLRCQDGFFLFVGVTPVLQVCFGHALFPPDKVMPLGLLTAAIAKVGEFTHC